MLELSIDRLDAVQIFTHVIVSAAIIWGFAQSLLVAFHPPRRSATAATTCQQLSSNSDTSDKEFFVFL